jgi:multicomponent Na+:H+ antiporter subunit D
VAVNALLALPVGLPIAGAAVALLCWRHRAAQRVVSTTVLAAVTGVALVLLREVETGGPAATQMGGLEAPLGITLVADLFSALMLVFASVTVLVVLVYAVGQRGTDTHGGVFHPVYLLLAAGVSLAVLTGDLFNLFVAVEVMLASSYVLITLGASREQVRSGMTYVVVNLLASTLLLVSIGLIYAATGTVNLADLSVKLQEIPDGLRLAFALTFLVVLGVKAAIFPLFFWLPDAYPTAPTPVTAVFAGLLTKVGVYLLIRVETLLFRPSFPGPSTLILTVAGITMLVGVLGAIAQNDIKRILSFHIVSQIGYMILGLGLFSLAGIAGAVFFVLNQIVVKTSLFLVCGLVEHATGTGSLARVSGLARRSPMLAVLFLLPALSLAGVPPLGGFVPKLALVEAGFALDRWVVVAAGLAASLLTLFSMTKIWTGAFWGAPEPVPAAGTGLRLPRVMVGATAVLVAATLAVAVAARPLYDLSERAAAELLHPSGYVGEVLSR